MTANSSNGRRRSPNNNNNNAAAAATTTTSSIESALDLPLPIASVVQGQWRSRRKLQRTPRRLATLNIPSSSSNAHGDVATSTSSMVMEGDASGTILCLVGQEYIVVANTVANGLCIYRLSSQKQQQQPQSSSSSSSSSGGNNNTTTSTASPDDLVAPWCVVSLTNDHHHTEKDDDHNDDDPIMVDAKDSAVIVSLTALPLGQSLVYGETCRAEEGHIVAVTDDGQGFVVRLRKDDSATKIFEFSTMNFGVTCASVVPAADHPNHNNDNTKDLQLLVGYQSGYLENWKIFRFSSDKILAKVLWRGMYSNNYTIHNMTPLNVTTTTAATATAAAAAAAAAAIKKEDDTGNTSSSHDTKEEDSKLATTPSKRSPITDRSPPKEKTTPRRTAFGNETKDHPRYLLLTLFSPTDTLKTGAMMEVIDIGPLGRIWKGNDAAQEGLGRLRAINLNKRWIMPAAGMEILNSSTIGTSTSNSDGGASSEDGLPRRAHIIPSTATGSICTLPEGNGTALPDGTIALLSATEEDGDLHWGITNDYNQLLLPYPAIGCASLNWGTSKNQPYMPHVACCLRGGSTYLIPFAQPVPSNNQEVGESTPVTVFTFDTGTHARYVSDFTAGNLILSSVDSKHKTKDSHEASDGTTQTTTPVLIYGWAGGIVDVYSCDLMETAKSSCRPVTSRREVSAIEELLSNGSLRLLMQLLSTLEDTDPLLHQNLWKEARRECREQSLEGIVAKDMLLPKFTAIRSLLLLLSTKDAGSSASS